MPRRGKKRELDPNLVYQAWQSVALHEPNIVVGKGQRLLGSHPAVQAAPWAFVPDGTSDDEVAHILGATEKEKDGGRGSIAYGDIALDSPLDHFSPRFDE